MASLTRKEWERKHQGFEANWWGTCVNTYGEETKQNAYAKLMGLDAGLWQAGNPWPVYDTRGTSIVDIGGGPVSMLLKCKGLKTGVVVDPCPYPEWTEARYRAHGIMVLRSPAEDWLGWAANDGMHFDEAWTYNVLQHVHDPELIVRGMRLVADRIRIFEWVETEPYLGHPHTLHVEDLQEWCGGEGRTVMLGERYEELEPNSDPPQWRVEQLAWGGVFG